jgi:hypothetical protein
MLFRLYTTSLPSCRDSLLISFNCHHNTVQLNHGDQIKNSKFRNYFFKIRKSAEFFFEKSEINQNEQFFVN